ncbi:hypothetical protein LWI29_025004 [Acer saccharum]|uniref:Uncharacterized protein n=1 Tax=Acer saccharum TaxID=4024 RepID=A0AA39VBQ4_ACESA|nr:hypothetical protein LWI29_025004 [Acer saccharum]
MSRKWSRIKTVANKVLRQCKRLRRFQSECKRLRRFQPECKRLLGFYDGKSSLSVQSPPFDAKKVLRQSKKKVLRQCKWLMMFRSECKRLHGFSDGESSPLVQSPPSDGDDDID